MRANLDDAFASKSFRVDDRDLIVVAVGRHDQRAIGRDRYSGRRRANLDAGGDGAGREIDLIEARPIEPGDVDKAARRIGGDPERRSGIAIFATMLRDSVSITETYLPSVLVT